MSFQTNFREVPQTGWSAEKAAGPRALLLLFLEGEVQENRVTTVKVKCCPRHEDSQTRRPHTRTGTGREPCGLEDAELRKRTGSDEEVRELVPGKVCTPPR